MRTKTGIKIFITVLALILGLLLTGCAREAAPEQEPAQEPTPVQEPAVEEPTPVTIRVGLWGSEEELNASLENAQGADSMFPGLTVEIQPFPSSEDFWSNLPAQIAAKTAPDIVKLTNEGAFEFIEKGLFVPIDNYVADAGLDLGTFAQSAKDIWTVDENLYGIPKSVMPAMFIINQDMWDEAGLGEPPTTWDEVREAARTLTQGDTKGIIINLHEFHLTNWILTFGGGWGNGRTINSDANVQALETIIEFYDEGLAITPKQAGFGWDGEVFANLRGAMSTGGWWYKGYLATAAPDINATFIPMPMGTTRGSTSHSDAYVVLKDAVDRVSAVKAAYWLTRDEALESIMERVGINPAKPALASKFYEVNPEFAAIEAMVPYSKDFGYPADTRNFNLLLVQAMEEKILGGTDITVREILDSIQEEFN